MMRAMISPIFLSLSTMIALNLSVIQLSLCSHSTERGCRPQMNVSSGEAHFNGKEVVLEGEVSIRHSLGQIAAHRIGIIPLEENGKRGRAALIKVSDHVEIQLEGGGCLNCECAEIDYTKMRGTFLGNPSHPQVMYRHFNGNGTAAPLFVVTSQKMNVDLVKEDSSEGEKGRIFARDIYALENVTVSYQHKYALYADTAHYERGISNGDEPFAGWISLKGDNGCRLITLDGDSVNAELMKVDTHEQRLSLVMPKGLLKVHLNSEEKERAACSPAQKELAFSAGELLWDHRQHRLHLMKDVHIVQDNVIELKTPYELILTLVEVNGQKTLNQVTASRATDVVLYDIKKGIQHKICCPGLMTIDHHRGCIALEKALTPVEEEKDGNQVVLENSFGEIFADRIEIDYLCGENKLSPLKIVFEGNVRVINRFNGHLQEVGGILHYAMADRLDYDPVNQEMLLSSADVNRVLFFDKVNNMQMSAPSLCLKLDKETRKETVQGIGDVRFTFIERELKQLKHYFQIEEPSKS